MFSSPTTSAMACPNDLGASDIQSPGETALPFWSFCSSARGSKLLPGAAYFIVPGWKQFFSELSDIKRKGGTHRNKHLVQPSIFFSSALLLQLIFCGAFLVQIISTYYWSEKILVSVTDHILNSGHFHTTQCTEVEVSSRKKNRHVRKFWE